MTEETHLVPGWLYKVKSSFIADRRYSTDIVWLHNCGVVNFGTIVMVVSISKWSPSIVSKWDIKFLLGEEVYETTMSKFIISNYFEEVTEPT